MSDDDLPEALSSDVGRLPHEHDDLASRYPRAIVCHRPLDQDPAPSTDWLEDRGKLLGQSRRRLCEMRLESAKSSVKAQAAGPTRHA